LGNAALLSWGVQELSLTVPHAQIRQVGIEPPSASNKLLQILAFNGGHDWLFALLEYGTVGRLATRHLP